MKPGRQNESLSRSLAVSVNNAQWLENLNYLEFAREISSVFNVNDMLRQSATEKTQGRSYFLEFNFMRCRSYDLRNGEETSASKAQFGGNDQ